MFFKDIKIIGSWYVFLIIGGIIIIGSTLYYNGYTKYKENSKNLMVCLELVQLKNISSILNGNYASSDCFPFNDAVFIKDICNKKAIYKNSLRNIWGERYGYKCINLAHGCCKNFELRSYKNNKGFIVLQDNKMNFVDEKDEEFYKNYCSNLEMGKK